jgi:hypothetical protein
MCILKQPQEESYEKPEDPSTREEEKRHNGIILELHVSGLSSMDV